MISTTPRYAPASFGLAPKVALVTGGTRGIGRGIAVALAAAGARVIVSGRDRSAAEQVLDEIQRVGPQGDFIAADLLDDEAVVTLVPDVVARHGRLDVLVNNAGIDADGPILDYDVEAWRRVMRVNLEVPFRLSQSAARHFVQNRGGAIVNVASVLSHVATMEGGAYVAAKHGLIGLTRLMAIELAGKGVRVNAVSPGLIQTDMTAAIWGGEHGSAYVEGRIPQGRIGQPQDLGGVVAFLASDAADFIHGQSIVADGGFLCT